MKGKTPIVKILEFETPSIETPAGEIPSVEIPAYEIPSVEIPGGETLGSQIDDVTATATKNVRTISEEVELAGNQLVEKVKTWIDEGTVRRIILRTSNNKLILEVPLLAGVFVGGILVVAAPLLAVLGAIGSLLAKVKVEVVRVTEPTPKA